MGTGSTQSEEPQVVLGFSNYVWVESKLAPKHPQHPLLLGVCELCAGPMQIMRKKCRILLFIRGMYEFTRAAMTTTIFWPVATTHSIPSWSWRLGV